MGRRLRPRALGPVGALAAAATLAACAGGATAPAGSWLHPSFGTGQLVGQAIVVLPVGVVVAPEGAPSDSAAVALALLAGDALAAAIEAGGAAGVAFQPAEALAALAGLSPEELVALGSSLDPSLLEPARGGELSPEAATRWRDVATRTEERYFLAPRSIAIERLEPLRVQATFDAWLVDATAGVVVWRARVSARNPNAPSGAAVDVYEAALEDAVTAAAGRLVSRLASLARTGVDDFEAASH